MASIRGGRSLGLFAQVCGTPLGLVSDALSTPKSEAENGDEETVARISHHNHRPTVKLAAEAKL
jgi:hypothetical protein